MRRLREIDKGMLLWALSLNLVGFVGIWLSLGSPHYLMGQAFRLLLALGGFLLFSSINYRKLVNLSPWLYAGLIAVLVPLAFRGGVSSWLRLGTFWFQPSEAGKFIIPLFLVRVVKKRLTFPLSLGNLALTGAVVGVPMVLVAMEPDLGTAFVYLAFPLGLYLVFGMKRRLRNLLVLAGIFLFAAAWFFFLEGYQKKRITSFLNPSEDPRGAAYQVYQSKISIGSGGLFGKGLREMTQAKLRFLPAAHTDFIFSVIAEGFGFLGVAAVLLLYFLLFYRIFSAVEYLAEEEAILLVVLLGSWMAFQTVFNLLIAVGLFPVTGFPLPLLSYGGSNLLATYISLGIINSTLAWRWE